MKRMKKMMQIRSIKNINLKHDNEVNEKICITESRYGINSFTFFLFNQKLLSSRYFVNIIFLCNTKSIIIWTLYLILEDLDIFRKDWDISAKPPTNLYSPFYIFTELCKCFYPWWELGRGGSFNRINNNPRFDKL